MATRNWSTQIYRALIWARFKIMRSNEKDAVKAIGDAAQRAENELLVSLNYSPLGFRRSAANVKMAARSYTDQSLAPIIQRFSSTVLRSISYECMDAERQTRAAVRAAIMGHDVRPAVQESAHEMKGVPDPDRPEMDSWLPYTDPALSSYGEIISHKFLKTTLDAWSDTLTTKVTDLMGKQYLAGLMAGESMEEIAKRLTFSMDIPRQSALKMARTSIMAITNEMHDKAYKANEDLLKGYKYTATLDVRTCPICGGYDGQFFEKDADRPSLPAHIDCRCTYVPVMKSWDELGLGPFTASGGYRASMDGAVPDTLTWEEWKKDPEIQKKYAEFKKKQAAKAYKKAKAKAKALAQ